MRSFQRIIHFIVGSKTMQPNFFSYLQLLCLLDSIPFSSGNDDVDDTTYIPFVTILVRVA